MNNQPLGYRAWLQQYANNSKDNGAMQARALLNIVGDDTNLDERFLSNKAYDAPGISRSGTLNPSNWSDGGGWKYNITDMTNLNNDFRLGYIDYKKGFDGGRAATNQTNQAYTGGGGGGYNQQAAIDQANLAMLNRDLERYGGWFKDIDTAEKNRLDNIANEHNTGLNTANRNWQRVQEDHQRQTDLRLGNRRRGLDVADDDFRNQSNAYDRFFARSGAGSSSAAQYLVPSLLGRATTKIRNDIEKENADNELAQNTAFNRAKENHETGLGSLMKQKSSQEATAKADFAQKRSQLTDKRAEHERQRALLQGKSAAEAAAISRQYTDQADAYARQALDHGKITEAMRVNPIDYQPAQLKPSEINTTQTRIEQPDDEERPDDAYSRLYDKLDEEKKKKPSWITAGA